MKIKITKDLCDKYDGFAIQKDSICIMEDGVALKLIAEKKAEIFEVEQNTINRFPDWKYKGGE